MTIRVYSVKITRWKKSPHGGEHGTYEDIGVFFESQLSQVLKDNLKKLESGDDIRFRLGKLDFAGPKKDDLYEWK
jgi:hypothetical protein